MEELVTQGDQKRWAQSIAFELISGKGAVALVRLASAAKAGAV